MTVSATVMSPCKDCTDRCIGCYSTCGDYAEYKQTLEANRAKNNAQNAQTAFCNDIKKNVVKRYNKRRDK